MENRSDQVEPPVARSKWTAAAAVVGSFVVAALPLMLLDYNKGRGAADQDRFHLPAIERFAGQWPHFDFSDYESATTPLYHVVLATADRFVSSDPRVLKVIGALFTIGLLATLALSVARRVDTLLAIAMCLPVVCSLYVFSAGAWLLPDNAAWWGVLGVLLFALRERIDAWTFVGGGLALLLLVLTRQNHLWAAAVLWSAAWLGSESTRNETLAKRVAGMVLATLPAFAAVGYFLWLWRGATPPSFQEDHVGVNPAIPALILSLFGIAGVFFLPIIFPQTSRTPRVVRFVLIGLLAGFLIGALPHTSYSIEDGRRSGLFNLIEGMPTIAGDRSPIIIGLATLGGAMAGLWFALLDPRDRWIFLVSLATFTAAGSASFWAYQRYYEPFVLVMLAVATSRIAACLPPPRWSFAGPIALSMLLAATTIFSLR